MIVYDVVMILCFIFSLYFVLLSLFTFKKGIKKVENIKIHKFAILIPCRNEENVISDILESLNNLSYPKDAYDIYVIPNNCIDMTKDIAIKMKAKVIDVKVLVKSKGEVLNYTFNYLKDKDYDAYVIFDADNIVHKNFLQAINQEFNNGYQVIQGFRDAKNANQNYLTGSYTMFYYLQNFFLNQSRKNLGMSAFINGTGFCVSKKIIDEYGFIFSTLTEDSEFTGLCAIRGIKIGYCQDAITYDEHPTDFKVSWIQRKRWSSGSLACLYKYGIKLLKGFFKNNFVALDCLFYYLTPVVQVVSTILPCIVFISKFVWGLFNNVLVFDLFSFVFIILFYLINILINVFVTIKLRKKVRDYYKGILGFSILILTWVPINLMCMIHPTKKWEPIKHNAVSKINNYLN